MPAIVKAFGPAVVRTDGTLNRRALAEQAFQHNQADALKPYRASPRSSPRRSNGCVGSLPPTHRASPMVESALIFEVEKWGTAPGWVDRFDKLILVTVPDEIKIERFVERMLSQDRAAAKETLLQDARGAPRRPASR